MTATTQPIINREVADLLISQIRERVVYVESMECLSRHFKKRSDAKTYQIRKDELHFAIDLLYRASGRD